MYVCSDYFRNTVSGQIHKYGTEPGGPGRGVK